MPCTKTVQNGKAKPRPISPGTKGSGSSTDLHLHAMPDPAGCSLWHCSPQTLEQHRPDLCRSLGPPSSPACTTWTTTATPWPFSSSDRAVTTVACAGAACRGGGAGQFLQHRHVPSMRLINSGTATCDVCVLTLICATVKLYQTKLQVLQGQNA
jgi:hypothetical protein